MWACCTLLVNGCSRWRAQCWINELQRQHSAETSYLCSEMLWRCVFQAISRQWQRVSAVLHSDVVQCCWGWMGERGGKGINTLQLQYNTVPSSTYSKHPLERNQVAMSMLSIYSSPSTKGSTFLQSFVGEEWRWKRQQLKNLIPVLFVYMPFQFSCSIVII